MPRKAKRLASWRDGNKRIESSFHQDIADIDLWDDEIEEKEKEEREKDATSATPKEEDWDAPEVQTEPGNGLTWDDMIHKDMGHRAGTRAGGAEPPVETRPGGHMVPGHYFWKQRRIALVVRTRTDVRANKATQNILKRRHEAPKFLAT